MSKQHTEKPLIPVRLETRDAASNADELLSDPTLRHVIGRLDEEVARLEPAVTERLAAVRSAAMRQSEARPAAISNDEWQWTARPPRAPTPRAPGARSVLGMRLPHIPDTWNRPSRAMFAGVSVLALGLLVLQLMAPSTDDGIRIQGMADGSISEARVTDLDVLLADDELDFYRSVEFLESLDEQDLG